MSRVLTDHQAELLEELVHAFLSQVCGGCKPFVVIVVPAPGPGGEPEADTIEVLYHGVPDDVPDALFACLLEVSARDEVVQ